MENGKLQHGNICVELTCNLRFFHIFSVVLVQFYNFILRRVFSRSRFCSPAQRRRQIQM